MTKSNINLIYKPTVHLVGQTMFNLDDLEYFIEKIAQENPEKEPVILDRILSDSETYKRKECDLMSEFAGRVCYQSYYAGRDHEEYIENILDQKHGSVLEHYVFNFVITGVSRSLTHELIRHRVGTAISEMSQRFVGANEKSGSYNFVVPAAMREMYDEDQLLDIAEKQVEEYEKKLQEIKDNSPDMSKKEVFEAAREFLPNWIETRIVWSVNLRQLRHFLIKRGTEFADMQIRILAKVIFDTIVDGGSVPEVFKDIWFDDDGIIQWDYEGV